MNEQEIRQEIAWIDAEPGWPCWPLLPVKNLGRGDKDRQPVVEGDEGIGVLVAGERGGRTLYFKNLWDFKTGQLGPQLEGVPHKTYQDTEALVRDGWIGD